MPYKISSACISNIGKVRENNEDNFCFDGIIMNEKNKGVKNILTKNFSSNDNKVFAIFDGMGGHDNGERASYLASLTLKEKKDKNKIDWNDFVFNANDRICSEMIKNKKRMGSTMAGIQFCDSEVCISNLGDSRIYKLYNDKLEQISEDHTEAKMSENLRKDNTHKSRLTQYLGIREDEMIIQPFQKSIEYENIDKILICSDGITDMVSEKVIEDILINNKTVECVKQLLNEALNNGGEDNITVMVFEIKRNQKEKILKKIWHILTDRRWI